MLPETTILSETIPVSEEIWVRRDLSDRGGLFVLRETFIGLYPIAAFGSLFILLSPLYLIVAMVAEKHPLIAVLIILIFSPLLLGIFAVWKWLLTKSRTCPLWLYCEQLNPETLTIFYCRKSPIVIRLANSTIKSKPMPSLYASITLTDKETKTSATLGLLTPEEYDRFMQYWNAAQKTLDA